MGIIRIIVSPSPPLSPSPSNPGSPMTNLSSGPSTAPIKTLESASASTSSSDLSVIELDDDRVGSGTNVGVKGKGKGKGMSKGENVGDGRKSKSGGKVVSNGKKRNAPVDSSSFEKPKGAKKAKITNGGGHGDGNGNGEEEKKEKGIYCHQCHRQCEAGETLRCTNPKRSSQKAPARPCNLTFCDRDLVNRYGTSPQAVRGQGGEYQWTCPDCEGECQNSHCRKKRGLEPLGYVTKPRDSILSTVTSKSEKISKPKPKPKEKEKEKAANGDTTVHLGGVALSDTSSLSEIEDKPGPSKLPSTPKSKAEAKVKSEKGKDGVIKKGKATLMEEKGKKKSKSKDGKLDGKPGNKKQKSEEAKVEGKSKGKGVATTKTEKKEKGGPVMTPKKGDKSKSKDKDKKPRAKPVKKPELPVDPPAFEKVDTRLGKGEVEHRIMLREYLNRFKHVLSVPDRSLPPLDDFDRPITEASVRVFAGAMLELFKEEVEAGGDDDLLDAITQHREELRYYADLARFANIYNSLFDRLKFPQLVGGSDFGDAGPSRRGASRIPQPAEVVRMLLSMAERTLATSQIRADLEWAAPENEARRVHAREQKKANDSWEAKKKKLIEARVQCSTPAQTKANKETYANEQKEYQFAVSLSNVNLHAALSRRALRHEPLGVDLDGRIYFCLSIRPIDEDTRPPIGWASGLLVWGKGVATASQPSSEDDLPTAVERWSHFGKSVAVRQLIKWVEWRTKKAVEAARPRPKTPAKAKANGTPNRKSVPQTPKTAPVARQTTLTSALLASAKSTPGRKRSLMEVVIPISKRPSPSENNVDDDDSDLSSLSSDDLLEQLTPVGYVKSAGTIEEEGKDLARRLMEVAEWLEVLEWKGMGEVR